VEFISHRAGNDPESLQQAESIVDVIEADIHLGHRGRVEVRHAKRAWPTRRLWERWYWLPGDTRVPTLAEILGRADPSTEVWLDLKGFTGRLSTRALEVVGGRRPLTISTKAWWLLPAWAGLDAVRTLRSAGNRLELAMVWLLPPGRVDGVVVHHRLLTDAVLTRLKRRGLVFTWAVDDVASIERLARFGVDGVILDDLTLVAPGRAAASAVARD
jgi:Glycerophosphoryl diester phosphodiesterase family